MNNALILYASNSGNTEKVARQFQAVLEHYRWSCTSIRLDEDTDLTGAGIFLDHYDLVLLGTPVISSSPSPMVGRHLALVDVDPPRLYSNQMFFPGSFFRPDHSPLGVVFVTYSGETYGPAEALPAMETACMYLKYLYVDVVGKFACPGKKASKSTIDLLASELKVSPHETAQMLDRYAKRPDAEEFSPLSGDLRALLDQAVTAKRDGLRLPDPEGFTEGVWRQDLNERPHARDLEKARIFLEEILEDYFTADGLPKQPGSVYTCIG